MKLVYRVVFTIFFMVIAVSAGYWIWSQYMNSPWTRDGRVRAEIITISPDVSGWVSHIDVKDNQQVKQGDSIFVVDDTRSKAAVAELEAQLENKRYAWELAQHMYTRRQHLTGNTAISEEDLETSRINTDIAKSNYDLALAKLNTAKINLERSVIRAPKDGTIINLNLRQGNYVKQGGAVLALIKAKSFYVTGYFEETKMPYVQVGKKAIITLMSGGTKLYGHVRSIGKAIADGNTNVNGQLLPQVQQSFNWVRLAQRIPVDIAIDEIPDGVFLGAGMTVSIHIDKQ